MNEIEKERLDQLIKNIPDIWQYKDILYVGAYQGRFHFWEEMKRNNSKVWLVEIDSEACDWLRKDHIWLQGVVNCNIKDFRDYIENNDILKKWQTLLWSHGVCTLEKNEGFKVIKDLEKLISKLLVHIVPYGTLSGTGNASIWYPEDFVNLGYKCSTLGNIHERNSNLLAWKYVK